VQAECEFVVGDDTGGGKLQGGSLLLKRLLCVPSRAQHDPQSVMRLKPLRVVLQIRQGRPQVDDG